MAGSKENGKKVDIEQTLDRALDHHRAGRLAEAETGYRQVLERDPEHGNALNLLGLLALSTGFVDDAIDLARRAVSAAPDTAAFHANLGTALMEKQRGEHAESALRTAMKLGFEGFQAPFNLGLLLLEQGRRDDALDAFGRALAIDPDHPDASFLVAALRGEHREAAPSSYVISLFDSYAAQFEDHVTNRLDYRIPRDLRALVARELPDARDLRIADVGCGTGLCGLAFRDLASYLSGCDVSPRMAAVAQERGIYDAVEAADLMAFLAGQQAIDLIVAADVFIYVGALEAAARAMARALRPGGWVAFSVESARDTGFVLRPSGRFAHSAPYLDAVARVHGFTVVASQPVTIRQEADRAIEGTIDLWCLERC